MKLSLSCLLFAAGAALAADKRPNILFILTDDQDMHMEGADHMEFLKVPCLKHQLDTLHRF